MSSTLGGVPVSQGRQLRPESRGDGLWSTGLGRRADLEPACVGCDTDRELTLLWRRSKAFRRHRAYR